MGFWDWTAKKVNEAGLGLSKETVVPKNKLGGYAEVAYLPTQKVRLPMKYAKLTQWFFAPILGQPRGVDVNNLRYFCNTTFVKICTQTIIDEVSTIAWKIVPIDEENEASYSKDDIVRIEKFLNNPNRNNESLSNIFRTFTKDLLEIDAAVIVKVFNSGDYEDDEYEEIPEDMYRSYHKKTLEVEDNDGKTNKVKIELNKVIKKGGKYYVKKSKMRQLGTKVKSDGIKKFVETMSKKDNENDKFELTEIYARDGASFLKDVDLFGVNYGYWQYSYMQPSYMPRWFDQKEIIYSCLNPRSEHTYGWAPIQSIMEVVESLNNSIRWNRDFFYNSAIPAGIVDFGNMDEDTLKAVKAEWQQGLKGKAHKLLMVSNPNPSYSEGTATQSKSVTFTAFQKGAREMEFLESQKWYSSLVTSAFKCSPAELGILGDVKNKAIQEGQERVHVRRAIKPILAEIEYKFNTQLITEFFNQDDPRGKTGGLRFEFDYIDPVDEAKQKENEIKDLEAGVITVNEVRLSRGMEPVDWGDEPMSMNNQPEFDEEDPFDKEVKQEGAEKKDKDDNPNAKKVKKAASFDSNTGGEGTPGSAFNQTTPEKKKIKDEKKPLEVIDTEYKGYSDYLEGVFKKCKKKIKKYVETELKEETFCKGMTISADKGKSLKKSYTFNKSFSGFLSKMINTLFKTTFSDKFYNDIEKYIKKDLKIGIKDAEEALQKEIIVKDIDTQALLLTDQQIQGYTLWNGNKFVGIKGAVDSVQKQIINNLNQAIGKEDVSMSDLTKAVDDAWTGNDGIDEYRTLRIARTETSRIINKGKLQGAHDSGLEVKKKWVGYPGMCPICEELSKQAPIELDEWFVHGDDKVQHPPIHPNDRCGIKLVNK